MKKLMMVICYIIGIHCYSFAQNNSGKKYLSVGDTIPNHVFTDLTNYPKNTLSISEFRGKWLILDTWAFSCSACIASFPKMDSIQEHFKDNLKLIMVAATKFAEDNPVNYEKKTKNLYTHLVPKYHMKFTGAFDSLTYSKWDMNATPLIFIIDPKGVVRVRTTSVSIKQIEALMAGKPVSFLPYFFRTEPLAVYDEHLPLLTTGKEANGGNDTSYLYRSVLKETNEYTSPPSAVIRFNGIRVEKIKNNRLEVFRYGIDELYKLAYLGRSSWSDWERDMGNFSTRLYLNLKDSSNYISMNKKMYDYSVSLPPSRATSGNFMKAMQNDLENYFGYKASVVKRDVQVYKIQVADESKVRALTSKGGKYGVEDYSYDHLQVRNMPINSFVKYLASMLKLDLELVDDTGLDFNIDVDFKANMVDEKDVKQKLAKYGFKLVKGVKNFDVIELVD